ncbi:MAG TPA: imidazole glycerol phosphate synthase subunit HisH [Solirubrobacteraceae bacterium]|jgi:glutamine amidotransferase|nr:imidazole glycerol phosphate synthase subunit HisH [Solirubrobacteraceae bacterium]
MSTVRPRVAIVDYDMGNRRSVEKALQHVGADAKITRDHGELREADAIVLPGVGAFPMGVANLRRYGLDTVLAERAAEGTPLLGICLGMQLLFDSSTELGETTPGLRLVSGEVRVVDAAGLRVPHIGWSEVRIERDSPLTGGLPAGGAPFYHVHSFVAHPRDPDDIVGTAEYGERFATIVGRGSVHGTQFHPEKSSRDGLALLTGFVRLAQSTKPRTVYA